MRAQRDQLVLHIVTFEDGISTRNDYFHTLHQRLACDTRSKTSGLVPDQDAVLAMAVYRRRGGVEQVGNGLERSCTRTHGDSRYRRTFLALLHLLSISMSMECTLERPLDSGKQRMNSFVLLASTGFALPIKVPIS